MNQQDLGILDFGFFKVLILKYLQASCRNAFLEDLRKLGDKYKKKSWGWLWSEAVAQPDLEASVDVGGFGYPAMVVVRQTIFD